MTTNRRTRRRSTIALASRRQVRRSGIDRRSFPHTLAIANGLSPATDLTGIADAITPIRFALPPASGGSLAIDTAVAISPVVRIKRLLTTFEQAKTRAKSPGTPLIRAGLGAN